MAQKRGITAAGAVKKKAGKKTAKKNKRALRIVDGVPLDLLYVANSPIHGKGLFAAKKIRADLTLGPLLGKPTKKDGTYVLWLSATEGLRVTNDYRFINHDDNPNCALTGEEVVTLRAIAKDEELTHDYGWE